MIDIRMYDRVSKKYRELDAIVFNQEFDRRNTQRFIKLVTAWGTDVIQQKDIIVQREKESSFLLEMHTGSFDVNKVKIFEGDVVEAYKHNERKFVELITFKNGCFWFGNYNWVEFIDKFRNIKVIGNKNSP